MSETKQTGKYTSWILLGGFLMLTDWKCGQGYKVYRSLSNGFILWLRPAAPLMSNGASSFPPGTTKMHPWYVGAEPRPTIRDSLFHHPWRTGDWRTARLCPRPGPVR
jgi:hypothetical protein